MRLKTKLVLALTALTFAIVLVLAGMFAGELLRQRIEQTWSSTDVQAHQVWLMMQQAVVDGFRENPPLDHSEEAFHAAVVYALRNNQALQNSMNAIVRYSPTVEDVRITDAQGMTLVSTDPDEEDQEAPLRMSLKTLRDNGVIYQAKQVFGGPQVFEVTQALDRNGKPFLTVRIGVRSTLLSNTYAPWLRAALIFSTIAGFASILAAGVLANLALMPIEQISRRLEMLTQAQELGAGQEQKALPSGEEQSDESGSDAVVRVTKTIERLGEQMRTKDAGYTALQANLNQMLDTLRDGVLLFTADRRAVMVSDAVEHFMPAENRLARGELVGRQLGEIFPLDTALGAAVLEAFERGQNVTSEAVMLEDGREVQISLDLIDDGRTIGGNGDGHGKMGTLLTLRDPESAAQLGQELEVSRRLAAIGRLTAGVGHEVKNPINAMVVHLELLRSKLANGGSSQPAGNEILSGAQRHVEILSGEMKRLDRVVQTLADFSRPMELQLQERDLRVVVKAVIELTEAEMAENGVEVERELPRDPLMVRIDAESMQQALLNLLLNAMQAMPRGGKIRVSLRRDGQFAVLTVEDEGEGIRPEVLPRIFELYFTTKPKGSGIGLAMTYRILQLHGGALDVRSNADPGAPDHGTTFTLKLPVVIGDGRKPAGQGVASGSEAGMVRTTVAPPGKEKV
jgi:signal transduction histidine kinase